MSEYDPLEGIPTVEEIGRINKAFTDRMAGQTEPVRLVPTLSDAGVAADLKRRLIEALEPVLAICDEADSKGFTLGFSCGKGPLGEQVITQLVVAKHY